MRENGMPARRHRGPMGPGPGFVGEKPKDFKGSSKKLIKYLGKYWIAIVIVMIFAAASTVFSVAGPKVKRQQLLQRDLWIRSPVQEE